MQKVLTAEQMREIDRLTTERYGVPSILLMENAAHAVARVITEKLGGSVKGKSVLILCGKGNNGGDGAALGWKFALADARVEILLFGRVADMKGDARVNMEAAAREVDFLREIDSLDAWETWLGNSGQDWDVIVDALFGTGLTRPLDDWLGEAVRQLNILNGGDHHPLRICVSIDIPSGLDSDVAEPIGENVRADMTVSFTAPKPANVLAPASRYGGRLIVEDIGSPEELVDEFESNLLVAEPEDASAWLRATDFRADSYKNRRGHTLLIAGSRNYSGAAVLAGNAAMRSGVGLVTLACPAGAKKEIASRLLPEVILSTIDSDDFAEHVKKADAIAVGCGLDATDADVERLVRNVVENRTVPVVVDAGALWFLNPPSGLLQKPARSKGTEETQTPPLILTPHEGEFLRLLGTEDKEATKDRVAAVRKFATANRVILVLKGERVLIGEPGGKVVVNPTGNSGLGKAGNGDTLAGVLAGFTAQAARMNLDLFETVVAAVYAAGVAGDIAEVKYGKRVMTASDVRECLSDAFARLGLEAAA